MSLPKQRYGRRDHRTFWCRTRRVDIDAVIGKNGYRQKKDREQEYRSTCHVRRRSVHAIAHRETLRRSRIVVPTHALLRAREARSLRAEMESALAMLERLFAPYVR